MGYDNDRSLKRYQFPAQFMYHGDSDHTNNDWHDWQGAPGEGRHQVKRYMPPATHPKLLNLGGNWIEANIYQDQGYDCTNVVLTQQGCDLLISEGFKAIRNDMCDLVDVENGSFDGIITVQALEHVWYPWKAFFEMYRVLRDGGGLILNAPQWKDTEIAPDVPSTSQISLQHCSCLQPYQMRFMIRTVGFRLLHHEIGGTDVQQLNCVKMSFSEIANFPKDNPLSAIYDDQHARMLRDYCAI